MVVLNVMYTTKEGCREAYLEALNEHSVAKRCMSEPGCLLYSFFVPVDDTDKNTVFLLEQYEDEAAFEFHKVQQHFLELQEIKKQFVESTDVQIFNK